MTKFLIPIKASTPEALAAVQFALELGKRTGGILFFLFVQDTAAVSGTPASTVSGKSVNAIDLSNQDSLSISIEFQINQAGQKDGLQVQTEHRYGDFIQVIHDFVREHHIDEIIHGVSDEAESQGEKALQNARLLFQLTHCRILTVKPKPKEPDPLWNQLH